MGIFTGLFGEPVPTIHALELVKKLKIGKRPLGEMDRRLNEVPFGHEVVCICATGNHNVLAVRKLTMVGYTASSLKNGMIAWNWPDCLSIRAC
jgi:rhodanese-related sulfurtransferase